MFTKNVWSICHAMVVLAKVAGHFVKLKKYVNAKQMHDPIPTAR